MELRTPTQFEQSPRLTDSSTYFLVNIDHNPL
jgi:hypothetical protein